MEFAARLPSELKAGRGRRKRILRSALRGWIPDTILDAPKRGFELPVAGWLRGELRDYAREVLLDPTATSRGWCNEDGVHRLLDEHCTGTHDHGRRIWTLLMLELWYRDALEAPCRPTNGAYPLSQSAADGVHAAKEHSTALR